MILYVTSSTRLWLKNCPLRDKAMVVSTQMIGKNGYSGRRINQTSQGAAVGKCHREHLQSGTDDKTKTSLTHEPSSRPSVHRRVASSMSLQMLVNTLIFSYHPTEQYHEQWRMSLVFTDGLAFAPIAERSFCTFSRANVYNASGLRTCLQFQIKSAVKVHR